MKIAVACPSYKRADRLETPRLIPDIQVVVSPEEAEEYREKNPTVHLVVADKGIQGNIARVRNWMIDNLLSGHDALIVVDDDFQGLFVWENTVERHLAGADFDDFVQKYSFLAWELGAKLWGVNVNRDPQCYRELCPFSFKSYVGAPFQGIMAGCELRYDEKIPLKEDYDFTLQHLNRYRKILRVNHAFYKVRQVEQVGGCSAQRSIDEELRQLALLQQKWGSDIVRTSNRAHIAKTRLQEKRVQINPIIRAPIRGI